jgi:hypothetical protein
MIPVWIFFILAKSVFLLYFLTLKAYKIHEEIYESKNMVTGKKCLCD